MKRAFLLAAAAILLAGTAALAGTQVYQLSDEPFQYDACHALGNWDQGPAVYFGQDVCVHYESLYSAITRVKTNRDGTIDIGWSLIQTGTATVTSHPAGEILYVGPFQVEEIGQDDGNDAACVSPGPAGDPFASLQQCGTHVWSTLDFARWKWKITGARVYFYEFRVTEPGKYCYLDDQQVIYDGGGCPPGK